MELLEPNDPKNHLLKKSAQYRQQLEDEVKFISDRTEKVITNVLIIGGTLTVAYFLARQLSSGRSSKRAKLKQLTRAESPASAAFAEEVDDRGPSIVEQIGTAIATQAAIFLLDLAKEKLSTYIQGQMEEQGGDHERS